MSDRPPGPLPGRRSCREKADSAGHRWPSTRACRLPLGFFRNRSTVCRRYVVLGHFRPRPRTGRGVSLELVRLEDRTTPAVGGGFTAAGVAGDYFANPDPAGPPAFTRRDVRLDFAWDAGAAPGGSTSPAFAAVPAGAFSARWAGQLVPQFTEPYTFVATADDGFRLRVKPAGAADWTTVIDPAATGPAPAAVLTGTYAFTAGQTCDVAAEYRQFDAPGTLRLARESPSTPLSVVEPLGIVGGHADTYTPVIFADAMTTGRAAWGTPANVYDSAAPLDADGWPTADAANVVWEGRVGPEMSGTYRVRFAGTAAYRSRCGTAPGQYTAGVLTGSATTGTITGLAHGTVVYLAVVAENASGLSLPSAERAVSVLVDGQIGHLAAWEFAGEDGTAAGPDAADAVTTGRLVVSPLTRGPGLVASNSSWAAQLRKGRFASEPHGTVKNRYGADLADAAALQQYYQFSAAPVAGVTASFTGLDLRPYFQNPNASLGVGVQYSLDGVHFVTVYDALVSQASANPLAVDLGGVAALQGVTGAATFRVYLYGSGKYEVTGLGQSGGPDLDLSGMLVTAVA